MSTDGQQLASRHYFDRELDIAAVKLLPGEYFITSQSMMLTTVLGSCVSACVRDTSTCLGGMNHFMLPDADPDLEGTAAAMRYGVYAMETLLHELLKAGAKRERLEAKVFGGGAVLANMTLLNVGDRNADFVLRYLQKKQIRVAAQDLRGSLPRRINYFPGSGKVNVRKLLRQDDALLVQREEQALVHVLLSQRSSPKLPRAESNTHRHFSGRIASIV
jgi:chemotaxis protein CheD